MPMFSVGFCKPIRDLRRGSETLHGAMFAINAKTAVEDSGKLDFGEYELEMWNLRYNGSVQSKIKVLTKKKSKVSYWCHNCLRSSCASVTITLSVFLLILLMTILERNRHTTTYSTLRRAQDCSCVYELVESIPENLTYPGTSPHFKSTFSAWSELIGSASESLDLAVFYWSLLNDDITPEIHPSSQQGAEIFEKLLSTGLQNNGPKIRIAQNTPKDGENYNDSLILKNSGAAEVRSLNFNELIGAGVLHTKFWIVDNRDFYIGSANMDWRSLTQVKELGVVVKNCSCLASDLKKIFDAYWYLGQHKATIPKKWPAKFNTAFNINHPMKLSLGNKNVSSYFSSSPPPFCPEGRSNDVDAIIDTINKAEQFIYIDVMDYFPKTLYSFPHRFWPVIDDNLRKVALERQVRICLLVSYWSHTIPDMKNWLMSLAALKRDSNPSIDINVKFFVVPTYTEEQARIPYSRVNHNKYMVTDKIAYIGTSNWSEDYFVSTGGVGFVVYETNDGAGIVPGTLRSQLQSLFERDWNSEYAKPLEVFL